MITRLDILSDPLYYEQITQLDGREYLLRFIWAPRAGCWYLGIYDQDENPIALSIKLVINLNLLRRFKFNTLTPPGALLCADLTGQNQDIATPGDLNTRVPLYYISADDPALAGAA